MELTIDKVIKGGLGLGRTAEGQVVMVGRALPGETVRVAVRRKHRGYLEADLVEVLTPSSQRVTPPCPVYEECGGCDLQHASYPEQLRIKNSILAETLGRAGLCKESGVEAILAEPLASPRTMGYRQRLRLQVVDGRMGFFSRRSHDLVAVRHCPLAGERPNQVLAALADHQSTHGLLAEATALELLDDPGLERLVLLVHAKSGVRKAARRAAVTLCQEIPLITTVCFARQGRTELACVADTEDDWTDTPWLSFPLPPELCGRPLALGLEAGSFCQVNPGQNENCIRLLLEIAKNEPVGQALDLFCGMGNFSLPLAAAGWRVTGMDVQRSAITSAIRNAEANGLDDCCRFDAASAKAATHRLVGEGQRFDLILLDPPRSGCAELIPLLPDLGARRIVAISCDPATLARDLAGLVSHGYRIEAARMVDMFPQTSHLESMVSLVREE